MKTLALILVLCCGGCVSAIVPKTSISGSLNGKPFALKSPKNSKFQSLTISSDSNGAIRVEVVGFETIMDPQVITTTTEGQVKLIGAATDAALKAAAQGAAMVK